MFKGKNRLFTIAPSVKFPRIVKRISKNPICVCWVILTIPIIGFILECFFAGSALSRSGCILVAFAISAVYINHNVKSEISTVQSVYRASSKMGGSKEEILKNINPEIDDNIQNLIVETTIKYNANAPKELETLKKSNDSLIKIEFIGGILGTLIWGFGDLIAALTNTSS